MPLGQRVDLPPFNRKQWGIGPWQKSGPPAVNERIAELERSIAYYIAKADKAWAFGAEQRTRRLDIEQEFAAAQHDYSRRPPPEIRYVERKVYTPMPPKEVKVVKWVERAKPDPASAEAHIGQITAERVIERSRRKFFGRIGDKLDRLINP